MTTKRFAVAFILLTTMVTFTACGNDDDSANSMSSSSISQSTQSSTSSETSSKQEKTVHREVKKLVDDFVDADKKAKEALKEYNAFEQRYGGFDNIPPEKYSTALEMLTDLQDKQKTAQELADKIANIERTFSDLNDKDLEYCRDALEKVMNQ